MRVNVVELPAVSEAIEQLTVPFAPTAGVVQLNAGPLWPRETKVVCGSSTSERVVLAASEAPMFDSVIVQVTGAPATSDGGTPLFVTARAARSVTFVVAVQVLFAGFVSFVVVDTFAVFETLPEMLPAVLTTSVKTALAPLASEARLQVTVPPEPTAGFVQPNGGPLFLVLGREGVVARTG